MEVKILNNKRAGRLILVDKKTGKAFTSVGKKDKIYIYLIENQAENIHEYTPTK
jgi:hypothetical protein